MEGKLNFREQEDKSGKKPHFKGFITIDGEEHEFAAWPAKNGNGFSGNFKPKQEREGSEQVGKSFAEREEGRSQSNRSR